MRDTFRQFSGASLYIPRGKTVTASDKSPLLQVVSWLLIAITSLTFGFRLLTRVYLKARHAFEWEDVMITIAFVLGLGEFITVIIPQGAIIGRRLTDIPEPELTSGIMVVYARDILFLLSIAFAKLSVCWSFVSLSPDRKHRQLAYILGVFIALWAITSLLTTAFQCGVKEPWDTRSTNCIAQQAFLSYVTTGSILTDVGLIGLPVIIVSPLNMALQTRFIIISFFLCRILAIIATIFQLIYLPGLFRDDFTFEAFPYYLSMQLVQFTSLVTAFAVYFWPFLQSLRSGLIWLNDTTFSSQYALATLSRSNPREQGAKSGPEASINRGRRNYVKITTDISLSTESGEAQKTQSNIIPSALLAPNP
ncbi:hypothetical protein GGR58DRAFT_493580 [Xylaria digitata]|nr:hypothetical protein GGR58DRAFT_493580 [Xylaria digitata]